jgi:hypothetical protein
LTSGGTMEDEVMAMERPLLVTTLLGLVQNHGRVSANLGTWDGDAEIHEGDVVLVTDAGAGPYEATVESIDGSWAQLRVHAFATEKQATA